MLQRWELDPALLPPPPASRQPPNPPPPSAGVCSILELAASPAALAGQRGRGWGARGAARGAHTGGAARVHPSEPGDLRWEGRAGCCGQLAGLGRASGASSAPARGRGAGAEGSPALQMPAGQRGNGLSPFRPRQPSQNPDTPRPPSHSFRRKIRMAAATILAVFLSFAHPPRCQQLLLTPSKASPNPAVSPHFYAPGAQPPFSPHPPDYCSRILTLTLVLLHTAGPATAASVVAGSHLLC